MENFTIRSANLNDAETIAKVQRQSWQETYENIFPASYLSQLPLKTDMWKQIISGQLQVGFSWVMVSPKKEVVGFVSGGKCRPEAISADGEICALYLLKQYHGRGLGKQLFLQGARKLRDAGYKSFCVYVLTQNPTIQFYRKFRPDTEVQVKFKLEGKEYDETGLAWTDIQTTFL